MEILFDTQHTAGNQREWDAGVVCGRSLLHNVMDVVLLFSHISHHVFFFAVLLNEFFDDACFPTAKLLAIGRRDWSKMM